MPPPAPGGGASGSLAPGGGASGSTAKAETLTRAHALHRAGRLAEAEPLYRGLLRAAPDDVDLLNLLGVLCHHSGRAVEGVALFEHALERAADRAALHNNLGAALRDLNRPAAALDRLAHALRLDPAHAGAQNNRAAVLLDLGRAGDALAACEQAIAQRPDDVQALYHRARCLQSLGRAEAALAGFDRVLALRPDLIPALDNRVELLRELGRTGDALAGCERLLALDPQAPTRWHLHGSLLLGLDRPQPALRSFERAIALAPGHAESHHDAGLAWTALGRPDLALAPLARALALRPDLPFLPGLLLHTRLKVCDWAGLDTAVAELAAGIDAGAPVTAPFPTLLLPLTPAQQLRAARNFVAQRHSQVAPALPAWPRGPRIRLGYFSPDFHQSALALLCAGLFEQHDRSRFEVIAFSFGPPRNDAMRLRLQAGFERFIDVHETSDAQVVALARSLRIDIAIDLAGFTAGSRSAVFAGRCAPWQVSMIGFPGSMGADFIDAVVADGHVIPPGQRFYFSERVLVMPHSYFVNDARRALPGPAPSRASVGLPAHGFVFCGFNQNAKIGPAVFALWMGLLREVDGSVLWLLQDNPLASMNLRTAAQAHGIAADRLVFAPRRPLPEHLARHACADLFLDTLPYNAHTSACDALWAGLPVLTRRGDSFAGRVGASLLHAAGLPELVVDSEAEYTALALLLAREPSRLSDLRARLLRGRSTCALFDTAGYARDLESALVSMLEPAE